MAYRPSHVGLCVSDIEHSLRFYCEGLGFEVSDGIDLDSDQVPGLDRALEVPSRTVLRSQMIVLEGLKIELLYYTEPAVEGTPSSRRNVRGLTHLSFWVDDLVFVADPDGTRVELMEQPS